MRKLTLWVLSIIFTLVSTGSVLAADTNTLTVSANVVGTCKFTTGTSTLAFGGMDPSSVADATATGSVTFWCTSGASYSLSDDDGLHETAPNANRMQHTVDATEYVPYSLSLSPTSGSGSGPALPVTLTINGTVANADYVNALAGTFGDTVVITVSP